MKENKYDEPAFFEKYGQMPRSAQGLAAAGEWETLRALFPPLAGRHVLDLGCGYGWHCRYAAEQGAASVTGVDISERMLAVARAQTQDPKIRYIRTAIEDLPLEAGRFDLVLSSLALHYIASYEELVRKVHALLAPGGVFLFSAEHPIFTAAGPQDWAYAPDGSIQHFPVDNYFLEGARQANFLGEPVVKYHRTLTSYLNGLLENGFTLLSVTEPTPPAHMRELPGMADELRRPMMLIVKAARQ